MPDSPSTPPENFLLGQEECIKICVLKINIDIITLCSDEKKKDMKKKYKLLLEAINTEV